MGNVTAAAMGLQKLVVKFFAENPASVKLEEFIPVFHRWIQERRVGGILVDVADYAHLPDGPGVVLVGHEADYFMDSAEGPLGLLYNRKMPLDGGGPERILAAFRAVLDGCAKLEAEPEFKGRLKFKTGEALFIINDRLAAPNSDETLAAVKPDLEAALSKLYPGARPNLGRAGSDARERFGVRIAVPEKSDVAALLARLG